MLALLTLPIANRLLAALPRSEYRRLLSGLEPIHLKHGDVLYQPGKAMRHAYFPGTCLVALFAVAEEYTALEIGSVGSEGILGIPLALGVAVSSVRALVQGSGTAMRIKAVRFCRELDRSPRLRRAILRYAHLRMVEAAQMAVCSRFHRLEARLARLLLMTRDHMQSDDLSLTHEFLAQMLGVRRVGVTAAAGALQQRGLISYRRGNIRILDGGGLEAASCRCYLIVKHA
jgi:CRP-like cAMP-binding protein